MGWWGFAKREQFTMDSGLRSASLLYFDVSQPPPGTFGNPGGEGNRELFSASPLARTATIYSRKEKAGLKHWRLVDWNWRREQQA